MAGARIGLVLGAGGVVGGAFHAGVVAALAATTGWDAREAELLVGTSAGSVAATSLRAGLPPPDLLARSEGRPLSAEGARVVAAVGPVATPLRPRPDPVAGRRTPAEPAALLNALRRPWAVRPAALAAAMLPAGTVSSDLVADAVDALAGPRWPDRPLWVPAVRLSDGRRVTFGRQGAPDARPAEAVAASCAIPGWFTPVRIDGERYVDGGVHSPTNADLAAGLGLDLVVVSAPMGLSGRAPRVAPDQPLRRWAQALLDREALVVRRRGTPVLAFQPTASDHALLGLDAMDPSRRATAARAAYEATLRRLERPDTRRRLEPLTS